MPSAEFIAAAGAGRAEPPRAEASAIDPRRERILAEARALAPGPYGRFLWFDARCTSDWTDSNGIRQRGLTPTSRWWIWAIEEFFKSGKRWWFVEVGRGGSKSTTLERLAGSLSYLEERTVPPGQTWEYLFISVAVDDANRRIHGLEAAIARGFGVEDLRVVTSPRGHIAMLDVHQNKILLSSISGTISSVSGPNAIGIIVDEAAKLRDKSTNANPLREIIASVTATFRARPNIYAIVCSSAWTRAGAHYEAIHGKGEGDNDVRHIARIGDRFLGAALEGLEAVALWEERGDVLRPPNEEGARAIRAHAASLTSTSPNVPTWVANEMYGATPSAGALATRLEVQALPASVLGGLPRHMVWLREIASVPLDADVDGVDIELQCMMAAAINAKLAGRFGGAPRAPEGQLIKVPGARPGDARYAGPPQARGLAGPNWRKRGVL